jgi:hypothetical protein
VTGLESSSADLRRGNIDDPLPLGEAPFDAGVSAQAAHQGIYAPVGERQSFVEHARFVAVGAAHDPERCDQRWLTQVTTRGN